MIDFKNTIIIMTTNIGAGEIISRRADRHSGKYAKKDSESSYQDMKKKLESRDGEGVPARVPEPRGRHHRLPWLDQKDLKQIVDMELAKVAKRLKEKGFTLDVTEEAKKFLIEKGTNAEYGARPLRRAIENLLEDPLAEDLLRGTFVGSDTIVVKADGQGEDAKLIMEGTKSEKPEPVVEQVPEPVVAK